jgi:hypothetical protein
MVWVLKRLSTESKESHLHVILLVLGKRIGFRPALLLEVTDDVLPSDLSGFRSKNLDDLVYPGLVVTDFSMAHPIFFRSHELIKPTMHLSIGFSKEPDGLLAVSSKAGHGSPSILSVIMLG